MQIETVEGGVDGRVHKQSLDGAQEKEEQAEKVSERHESITVIGSIVSGDERRCHDTHLDIDF